MVLALRRQRSFLKKELHPLLFSTLQNDGTVGEKDLEKMKGYYGVGVAGCLGTAFGMLRGYTMSHRERLCLTMQGAVTGLVDDLYDQDGTRDERIEALTLRPSTVVPKNDRERLICALQGRALELVANREAYRSACERVLTAQVASRLQCDPALPSDELAQITWDKGGHSLNFYRHGMHNAVRPLEAKLFYALGAHLQLENDLFDIWKDLEEKVYTLPNRAQSVVALRLEYVQAAARVRKAAAATGLPKRRVKRALRFLDLITSLGFVCLDHLALSEGEPGSFEPAVLGRGALICDMSKPSNLWKWARYAPKMERLIESES